ncbi:MAG: FIST N-terminal domain-containing protein [Acidimicrobiales bacterium]
MPFASALSEHPVASAATGEVSGAVLERLGERPDLVVITTTRSHAGALEDIAGTVSSVLHPLAVVGGAAESVIGTGREAEETPAISLWAGWVGPLAPVRLDATRLADDSWHFAGWPEPLAFEPTVLILMADPFTFPADEFIRWLEERHPGLPVVGGNVSGSRGPGGSRLVVGDRVVTSGATGVLIGGGVDMETVVSPGSQPYGETLTVTRSDRNVIYEVAGIPAMECMVDQITRYLGPAELATIRSDGLFVGRLIDERVERPTPSDFLVRNVVGVDRSTGAVAVDDQVPLGSTVRFHRRDGETAHHQLGYQLEGRSADAALVFTGNNRGTRLFSGAHHDARMLQRSVGPVPTGGLFAAGEFGPVGGRNFVHAFSVSMALFRAH